MPDWLFYALIFFGGFVSGVGANYLLLWFDADDELADDNCFSESKPVRNRKTNP